MVLPHGGRLVAIAIGVGAFVAPRAVVRSGVLGRSFVIRDVEILAVQVAMGLLVLALVIAGLAGARRFGRRRADDLLVAAAGLSAAAWFNFGFLHGTNGIHLWEQFHYFLGSRYYAELGYDGLYVASLADEADQAENGRVPVWVRDPRTNKMARTESLLPHMREVHARFTPERWDAFSADHRFFVRDTEYQYLAAMRKDHGYNASPTWTFVAQRLGRWGNASSPWLGTLALLDPLLLAATFALVFRSFGLRCGCLSMVLFGQSASADYAFLGGSFLRFDWVAATGIALCMLERRRFATAGALIAYAGAVRIFPLLFLLGPAVLASRALLRGERPRWLVPLGAGFAATLAVCVAAGCAAGRGAQAWPEFAREIGAHAEVWLTNNVGLENLVLYDSSIIAREDVVYSLPEPWIYVQKEIADRRADRHLVIAALRAAFLLLLVAAVWRDTLVESVVVAMVAVFALTSATNYYWAMLLLVPLRPRAGIPIAVLGLNLLARAAGLVNPSFEVRYGIYSWGLALLFAWWIVPDALATLRDAAARRRMRGLAAASGSPAADPEALPDAKAS